MKTALLLLAAAAISACSSINSAGVSSRTPDTRQARTSIQQFVADSGERRFAYRFVTFDTDGDQSARIDTWLREWLAEIGMCPDGFEIFHRAASRPGGEIGGLMGKVVGTDYFSQHIWNGRCRKA
jgi:hypothetical protein